MDFICRQNRLACISFIFWFKECDGGGVQKQRSVAGGPFHHIRIMSPAEALWFELTASAVGVEQMGRGGVDDLSFRKCSSLTATADMFRSPRTTPLN